MTLIECFDSSPIENIIGCLQLKPDRVIFIGEKEKMKKPIEHYQNFLHSRGNMTKILFLDIETENIKSTVEALEKIILADDDFVVDLTGGEETAILSISLMLGNISEEKRKRISVQQFDLENNLIIDCDNDNIVHKGEPVNFTVEDLIKLYGGSVLALAEQPDDCYVPESIDSLWRIISSNPQSWNRHISSLIEYESPTESDSIYFYLNEKNSKMANAQNKEQLYRDILTEFRLNGIIDDHSGRNYVKYSYKNPLFHECVKKHGNLLEMKALLEARAVKENEEPLFNDCKMGVTIDWDGVIDTTSQTKNEIDLILMKDTIPLFVSCKNGDIKEEELYKLHTVASRFGGSYAKKMLIATSFERNPNTPNALIQRAKDMDIYFVENAANFDKDDWANAFKEALKPKINII